MSEFTCRNGHEILPSIGYCKICGFGVHRMDGKSARQLEAEDREWDIEWDIEEDKE